MSLKLAEARKLGFRDVPERTTAACRRYIKRITELRDFISTFFGLIGTTDHLSKVQRTNIVFKHDAKTNTYQFLQYSFSMHRQFTNEIMLSRAVESFELYVLSMLRDIFAKCPDMLKSEGTVDVRTVIDLKSFDEIVRHVVEQKIHDLSYKPLSELRQYVQSRTGLDLFNSDEQYQIVATATEIRHLIAHNDCRVDSRFRQCMAKMGVGIKIVDGEKYEIVDDWVRKTSYAIDGVVFDFDEAAGEKFSLSRA